MMTVTVFVRSKFHSQNGATYLVVAPAVIAADVIGCRTSVMKEELQRSHGEYSSGYVLTGVPTTHSVSVLVTGVTV